MRRPMVRDSVDGAVDAWHCVRVMFATFLAGRGSHGGCSAEAAGGARRSTRCMGGRTNAAQPHPQPKRLQQRGVKALPRRKGDTRTRRSNGGSLAFIFLNF
jgi:hypothetical protein